MGLKLTKKQTREFIRSSSYWDDELNDTVEFETVQREFSEKHRWCSVFDVILKCFNGPNEGKYYSFTEFEPATESQETDSYYEDELELIEVKPIKKMVEVTVWENV